MLIEGNVLKADDGLLYLFSSLKLTLAGQTVEHVNYPGQATSPLGLASYSSTYYKGCGLAQAWFPDINTNAATNNIGFYTPLGYRISNPHPNGSFKCVILMRHIFGFVDDYSKVTYGMRDTLQLICKDDNNALFGTAAAGAGKVVLTKFAWSVPTVQPNDIRIVSLYKSIASNKVIPVSFRMRQCESFFLPQARSTVWRLGVSSAPEKPLWVLVGLEKNKIGNQESNSAVFAHCDLTNMQVWLNHSKYPSVDMATDSTKEQYAGVYESFYDFSSRYYEIDNLLAGSAVSPAAFKSFYPIHIFDLSKERERLTEGVVDLTVRMEFSVDVPENTQAYALIISNRMLKFKSDGSKMSFLF